MVGRPVLIACTVAVLIIGGFGVGAGYVNGDAAVYVHQAMQADLGQRWVHLGWVALAAALYPIAGDGLPAWMDGVHVLSAASLPWSVYKLAPARARPVAAVAAVVAVLPWASGAEVDVPSVALMCAAAAAPGWWTAVLCAIALTVSPGALLMLPAVSLVRGVQGRSWWPPLVGVALCLGALSALSQGAWWWGDRGVLHDPHLLIGRTARMALFGLAPAAALFLINLRARGAWLLVGALPLLLAPPDTQLWLGALIVFPAIMQSGTLSSVNPKAALLALLFAVGLWAVHTRARSDERAMIETIAGRLDADTGLVAPWSVGVRVSLQSTGDPYSLRWHPPGRFVRDQRARWTPPPRRVITVK